jgi:hypothetical protein
MSEIGVVYREPMVSIAEALSRQYPCFGDCHTTLTFEQRRRAVEAIYHCDDALRGWGYTPLYDINGDRLWREAQQKNDPAYRGVAVRFGECIYRRLVGSMLHEVLHALHGDTTQANYGLLFGLPYGVPSSVPEAEEEAFIAPHNFNEACAFVGVCVLGRARFGIDWPALNAREWGTFCFKGGNALVQVPKGYRAVAHIDPKHHRDRYLVRARKLEEEAQTYLDANRITELSARLDDAAARGKTTRETKYPSPDVVARVAPSKPGRNDPCPCGSGKKMKQCCGENARHEEGAVPYMR